MDENRPENADRPSWSSEPVEVSFPAYFRDAEQVRFYAGWAAYDASLRRASMAERSVKFRAEVIQLEDWFRL